MKFLMGVLLGLLVCISCKSKKIDPEDLPKDVALKPARSAIIQVDSIRNPIDEKQVEDSLISANQLENLKSEILKMIDSETCKDASQWRISAFGAKPCGGPESYIAYPINLENELLKKITRYNVSSAIYNKQNNLVSDCRIVLPPTEIRCENGKPVLTRNRNQTTEVQ